MISFAESLPIGNAARVIIAPSQGVTLWRVLRKATDDIAGPDDSGALKIYEGGSKSVVDTQTLSNGSTFYYKVFEKVGINWLASGDSVGVLIGTTYGITGPDPLSFVRDRIRLGLKAAIAGDQLKPAAGSIKVYTAPPQFSEDRFPIVSVHLQQDASDGRAIGEMLYPDVQDGDEWTETDGWLSRVRLQVIVWSLNADERIALRQRIKAIIIGNLPVFDAAGMVQIDFSQTDVEDFQSYNSPVYQSIGDFSCLAPSAINSNEDSVIDVTVSPDGDIGPTETP